MMQMLPTPNSGGLFGAARVGGGAAGFGMAATAAVTVVLAAVATGRLYRRTSTTRTLVIPSPPKTRVGAAGCSGEQPEDLPYPPDGALPGGRDVETPYGSVRVYEWGPEEGERVLLVHGISTPVVALGDLAHELAGRGYRVMCFDLFGRGYSDAPADLPHDARLYVTQILLVLASSKLGWVASPGFHLVGYSLGGGICVAFARYHAHLVRSLSLIATCGLIRQHHVGWRSRLYYNSGLLPEWLVERLVRRRIRPQAGPPRQGAVGGADIIAAESERTVDGDGDSNGGAGFDSAAISKRRPQVTVSSVVRWQVDNHAGFVRAFLSSIRNMPVYAPQQDWTALSAVLEGIRTSGAPRTSLNGGRALMVLGEYDAVIIKNETVEDAEAVFGPDGVRFAVLAGGHELPITRSIEVADAIEGSWKH
ncbi:alpha/beta-hydrolase [Xylariaceae sp. FL0804]|nr:alpha/beta-hydrolase [Xylariaceae sp. FL0804]